MPPSKWKALRHPLYRGDSAAGIEPPTPSAAPSLVRHLLYLDGPGRDSPYLSTTEDETVAQRFAGRGGRVYASEVPAWAPAGVQHRSRTELTQLLRGRGKGDAQWPSAYEVAQARAYVEESLEHLADFRALTDAPHDAVAAVVKKLFR